MSLSNTLYELIGGEQLSVPPISSTKQSLNLTAIATSPTTNLYFYFQIVIFSILRDTMSLFFSLSIPTNNIYIYLHITIHIFKYYKK